MDCDLSCYNFGLLLDYGKLHPATTLGQQPPSADHGIGQQPVAQKPGM